MRNLVCALAKGRLADDSMKLFQRAKIIKAGVRREIINGKSRRLVFPCDSQGIEFFLAKAQDVPTYVEYGAADIGIAGYDSLLEAGRNLYEVLDLGIGTCRMAVAGPERMTETVLRGNNFRVATKYPNIAADHFARRKRQTVEIIMLNGSVELAPIVGLSDVIVDIVQTGGTLLANGLEILEEVTPVSARLVVNRASMKTERARVVELIKKIKKVL
jgi:ATP phosphoribosyltransferase